MSKNISLKQFLDSDKSHLEKNVSFNLDFENKLFSIKQKLNFNLIIDKIGSNIVNAHFDIPSINIQLICARCLEKFNFKMNFSFDRRYSKKPEKADDQLKIEDGKINVFKPIVEEIVSNIPTKAICKKSCKGLCQICGKNLNKGDCDCPPDKSQDKSSGREEFQKLKKIFDNNNKQSTK